MAAGSGWCRPGGGALGIRRFSDGVPRAGIARIPAAVDPQLDDALLSQLANPSHRNHVPAVLYANANKAAEYPSIARPIESFSSIGSKDQFRELASKYGIRLIREVSLEELPATALRFEQAFIASGTPRRISLSDARVAASAYLRGEKLATNDLQFFKRARISA